MLLDKTFPVPGTSIECGQYSIQSENIENYEDFIVTDLKITNSATGEERHVCHFQFTSWPDYGTPDSALSMLQFLQVNQARQSADCGVTSCVSVCPGETD